MCSSGRCRPRTSTSVSALDELWRRGVIREHGTDAYDFAHGKIRDAAYEALSPGNASPQSLGSIADDDDPRFASGDLDSFSGEDRSPLRPRRTSRRGGRRGIARAAVQAQRMHANVEAIRLLDQARELVAVMSPDGRRTAKLEILTALATPIAVTEGFASPRLASSPAIGPDTRRCCSAWSPNRRLLRSVAMTNLSRNDFDGSGEVASHAVARRQSNGRRRAAASRASTCSASERSGAERWTKRGRTSSGSCRLRPASDESSTSSASVRTRWSCASAGWPTRCGSSASSTRPGTVGEDALAIATEVGHPFSRGVVCVFAALLSVDLDENDRYRQVVAELGGDAQHHPFAVAAGRSARLRRRARRARSSRASNAFGRQPRPSVRSTMRPANVRPTPDCCWRPTTLRVMRPSGLPAADEALQLTGTRSVEPEIRRLRALFSCTRREPRRTRWTPRSSVPSQAARANRAPSAQSARASAHDRTGSRSLSGRNLRLPGTLAGTLAERRWAQDRVGPTKPRGEMTCPRNTTSSSWAPDAPARQPQCCWPRRGTGC